ncbi:BamA/TamA family outer membrane protein [Limibacter armeniacum]|uniref:BamA/TamA family outer membrane protein n=1 Tax=Limibacter armeniacum TaxID=466084 RepID=UPI002FE566CE
MNHLAYRFIFSLLCLYLPIICLSQKVKQPPEKSVWKNIDSLRIAEIEMGKSKFTPFIAPSYTPEMKFLFSAGGLFTFTNDKKNPLLTRSSIPFSVGISSNGSFQLSVRANLYSKGDKVRQVGEFWIKDMPDNYWGVGYSNGRNREQDRNTTGYHRLWWRFYDKIIYQYKTNYFVGVAVDLNKTEASDLNPLMEDDPFILRDGTEIRNSGIGGVFQFDSRDLAVNAYKGMLLDVSFIIYGGLLGGENHFQVLEIDYRQYKKVSPLRRVLAWQVKAKTTFSKAPWTELAQLGSPFDLRGYYWGRYRDESMLFGLLEYRHMFQRKTPNKQGKLESRSGFAAWTGLGAVGQEFYNLRGKWLPNIGVGYRLEVQPRMNLRIDFGLGVKSNALYFSFNEAF